MTSTVKTTISGWLNLRRILTIVFEKAAEVCCAIPAEMRSFRATFPRLKTKRMKLSFPFHTLQLLSVFIVACSALCAPRAAFAQAPAQAGAGTDFVILKPATAAGQPQQLANVLVVAVRGGKVAIRNAQGEISYNLAQIQEVRKAAPPEFAQGRNAIDAGDLEKALVLIKGIADRYKGLPTAWASDSVAMVGNIYVNLGKFPEAEAAFDEFQKTYPAGGSVASNLGKARIAAERGNFAEAKTVAEPIIADALTKKTVTRAESQLYGQAYYILGKVAESEGKFPEAMENYCRTVAIFYQERAVVTEAEKRIDALRKKGITTP
jgi:tetratricopeptide (TPR) repeat protein